MNKTQQTAASWFAKNMKKGGFVTADGNVFENNPEGKSFAKSHASVLEDKNVAEFDENGEEIEVVSEDELRAKYSEALADKYGENEINNMSLGQLEKLANDLGQKAEGEDEGEIDLDKMNKAQLIKVLAELDPTEDVEKHTKAKTANNTLKDLIEAANSLTGFDTEKLQQLAIHFGAEKQTIEGLDNEELKAVVLFQRDGLELPENVSQKMTGDGN